jgi:serine/threonine protein kinase
LKYPIERYLPRYLFSGNLSNLSDHLESLGVNLSSGLILFLEALLEPNAAQRTTVEKALAHPWIVKPNATQELKSCRRTCREVSKTCSTPLNPDLKYDQVLGG